MGMHKRLRIMLAFWALISIIKFLEFKGTQVAIYSKLLLDSQTKKLPNTPDHLNVQEVRCTDVLNIVCN